MANKFEIIKKITAKTVHGAKPKLARDEKSREIMKVYGQARTMATGMTDYGAFIKFGGSFEAVNSDTAEVFRSGTMLLPDIAADMLAGQLGGDGVEAVNFAFAIGIKEDEASATGYVYYCTPLIDAGESDPLAALKSQLVTANALPAPKGAPEDASEDGAEKPVKAASKSRKGSESA